MNCMRQSNAIQFEHDPSHEGAQSIAVRMHAASLLKNFSEKKPQIKSLNTIYLELF